MSVRRYELLQEIEGNTYGHEIFARSEQDARRIAKLIGARFGGMIVDEYLACDICFEALEEPPQGPRYNN